MLSGECSLRQAKLRVEYFQECVVNVQRLLNEGFDGRSHAHVDGLRIGTVHWGWPGECIVFRNVYEFDRIQRAIRISRISPRSFVSAMS